MPAQQNVCQIESIQFPVILTGPPGAGKSTFTRHHWPSSIYIDVDHIPGLSSKARLRERNDMVKTEAWQVFMTAAPTRKNKQYWLDLFPDATLLVLMPPLMTCVQSCLDRGTPRLAVKAQKWYARYQRHPREIHVERPEGVESYPVHPKRGLG